MTTPAGQVQASCELPKSIVRFMEPAPSRPIQLSGFGYETHSKGDATDDQYCNLATSELADQHPVPHSGG